MKNLTNIGLNLIEYRGASTKLISTLTNLTKIEQIYGLSYATDNITFTGYLSWLYLFYSSGQDLFNDLQEFKSGDGYLISNAASVVPPYSIYSDSETFPTTRYITRQTEIAEYRGTSPLLISAASFVNELQDVLWVDSTGSWLTWNYDLYSDPNLNFLNTLDRFEPNQTYLIFNKSSFSSYIFYSTGTPPPTPNPSGTPTQTPTKNFVPPTPNPSGTPTPTPTKNFVPPTPNPSGTPTPTPTKPFVPPTPNPSGTPTPTPTKTFVPPTPNPSATAAPTPNPSATAAPTPNPSATPASTPNPTASATPPATPNPTRTASPTPTQTQTQTPTQTATVTPSRTPDPTKTPTRTPDPTKTPTQTQTSTPTQTRTPTQTKTQTPTISNPCPVPSGGTVIMKNVNCITACRYVDTTYFGWLTFSSATKAWYDKYTKTIKCSAPWDIREFQGDFDFDAFCNENANAGTEIDLTVCPNIEQFITRVTTDDANIMKFNAANCASLTTVDLSHSIWNMIGGTASTSTLNFLNCYSLKKLDCKGTNGSNKKLRGAHLNGCTTINYLDFSNHNLQVADITYLVKIIRDGAMANNITNGYLDLSNNPGWNAAKATGTTAGTCRYHLSELDSQAWFGSLDWNVVGWFRWSDALF